MCKLILAYFLLLLCKNFVGAAIFERDVSAESDSSASVSHSAILLTPDAPQKIVIRPQQNEEHEKQQIKDSSQPNANNNGENSDKMSKYEDDPTPTLYVVPEEGMTVMFKCAAAGDRRLVAAWITPNGEIVHLDNTTDDDKMQIIEDSTNQHIKRINKGQEISFTKYQMTIYSVKLGMDGRYVCIFENKENKNDTIFTAEQRNFFIPYIVSHASFSRSVVLSAGISIVFCVICVLFLWINSNRQRSSLNEDDEFLRYGVYAQPAALRCMRSGTLAKRSSSRSTSTTTICNKAEGIMPARRKTQIYLGSAPWAGEPWATLSAEGVADATEAELETAMRERQKYLTRSFSTVGFDEILPTCVEKSNENSSFSTSSRSPSPSISSSSYSTFSKSEKSLQILDINRLSRLDFEISQSDHT